MGDDRPGAEHTPTVTEVPPADSIGRHLCEVTCSCGLFRTTALGRDAGTARADALHSFDAHVDRAGKARPLPPRSHPEVRSRPQQQRRRRGAPVVAAVAVSVVALAAVLAVLALAGNDYAGTPALVGGPDRTGPADLATTTQIPTTDGHSTERGDRYDQLRSRSDDVELWSDDRIDRVSEELCSLVRAGRTVTEMVDALAADGIVADEQAVRALRGFAERFDC